MRSEDDALWRYSLPATLLLLSPFDLLASLGMDMYLPVVPLMADVFSVAPVTIQWTLTTYLVLLGVGQLLFGPLSDRLGRRPILLGGGLSYAAASFALAAAPSSELFLAFRVLQGAGASACLVATFATLRDIYAGREESRVVYGLLGSMLAMVPAAGPLLGTAVDHWLGWRAIFTCLGVAMALAVIMAWRFWPETRRRQASAISASALLLPLRRVHFWRYTLGYSAAMGSFFVFFSTAPWLMMERLALSSLAFSLWFATVALAMMLTARVLGKLGGRYGVPRLLRTGMICLLAGGLLLALTETLIPQSLFGFITPMWLVGIGIAITVSVTPNGALCGLDHIAGTATALYFCLGGLVLGGLGTLAVTLLPAYSAWPIVAYCLTLATAVLCLSWFKVSEEER